MLSLTQPTDMGTMYRARRHRDAGRRSPRARGLRVHIDGARVANALAALGCSPADLTWRAGVDVLSLGATKNGALSAEAIVAFDDRAADELVYRTKRAGHVTSKMRFQSAQLIAYLTDGLWLRTAANANAQMADLATGLAELGVEFVNRPDVNMLFARRRRRGRRPARGGGPAVLPRWVRGEIRLVTSWQTTDDDIERALAAFETALA